MVLLSGAPVAFGLGALSILFIVIFQGFGALQVDAICTRRSTAGSTASPGGWRSPISAPARSSPR
jgi:hypothetical protein